MADSDKDILITPNTGATTDPKIVFSSGATSGDPITLSTVDDGTTSTLSFEGSAGQLFSISNDLTGTIFSVADGSGIPSIEADADGDVRISEFGGNVQIGNSSGNVTVPSTLSVGAGSQVNIGETPALVDGNNPRHVLHIGATTVNPSYEQLSMSTINVSGGENPTRIRMANLGNDFYLTNNYYNWGTHRFDEANEGQAFFKMVEDGGFSFGGRSLASTDTPEYNAAINGRSGSISAGSSLTIDNGLSKMNVVGDSDVSDEDVELRIVDYDETFGSAIPTISFYKGTGTGPTKIADIRVNDVDGVSIRDESAKDLLQVSLAGNVTYSGSGINYIRFGENFQSGDRRIRWEQWSSGDIYSEQASQGINFKNEFVTAIGTTDTSNEYALAISGSNFLNNSEWHGRGIYVNGVSGANAFGERVLFNSFSSAFEIGLENKGAIAYCTNAGFVNFQINVRGSTVFPSSTVDRIMKTGESITVVHMQTQGPTGYIPSDFRLDFQPKTVLWQGGSPPAPEINCIQVFSFTIIKTGSNLFTILGNSTSYS